MRSTTKSTLSQRPLEHFPFTLADLSGAMSQKLVLVRLPD